MDKPDITPSESPAQRRTSRDELARLIGEAFGRPTVQAELLHGQVCAFVRERRDAGDPPERVIVALKDVIDYATLRSPRTEAQTGLVETIVKWCIREFYRPADAPQAEAPPDHP
jgi:hypothetical protein